MGFKINLSHNFGCWVNLASHTSSTVNEELASYMAEPSPTSVTSTNVISHQIVCSTTPT